MTSYGSLSHDENEENLGLYQASDAPEEIEKSSGRGRRIGLAVVVLAGLAMIGASFQSGVADTANLRASASKLFEDVYPGTYDPAVMTPAVDNYDPAVMAPAVDNYDPAVMAPAVDNYDPAVMAPAADKDHYDPASGPGGDHYDPASGPGGDHYDPAADKDHYDPASGPGGDHYDPAVMAPAATGTDNYVAPVMAPGATGTDNYVAPVMAPGP